MEKDFDMDDEKSRVSNEGCNGIDLNLNEEIGVSSGVVLKDETDEIRVSNEGCSGVDLNEDIRVSSGCDLGVTKSEIDEIRVLPGEGRVLGDFHANGGFGAVDAVRVSSSSYDIDVVEEKVVKGENLGIRNVKSSNYEMGEPETPGTSGKEKSMEVEMGENEKPDLFESSKVYGDVCKIEGSHMDARDGNFKLESRGDLKAPMLKEHSSIDTKGSVMKSVSAKVLGTEFEMGDMVWGKVKSHPWWPGHLFNEAFTSSSVRRTRRDGNILIAFFGDSSYGWFDPEDLVPYDPHYAEKSQQTSLKSFVRAVEESVDEAGRRSALGLSCYCRNPCNFRPADMPGYLVVDIVDFEPGTVYSVNQIQKARDSFRPKETLSFIHQLATAPMGSDSKSLDLVKNKAASLAYRRSIFEEFDETYAEAFGHKPDRPRLPQASSFKEPSRAPLSGPLVFADTLGNRKSSTKVTKPKEQSKKDKYLFKRRDEPDDFKTATITQDQATPSSSSSAYEDGTVISATAGYVFQKRDQTAPNNDLGKSPSEDTPTGMEFSHSKRGLMSASRILTPVPQHLELDEVGTADSFDVPIVSNKPVSIVTPSDSVLKKKKKAAKRPASELSSGKPERQEKKVKKLRQSVEFKILQNPEKHLAGSSGTSPVNPMGPPRQVVPSTRDGTKLESALLTTDWENEVEVRQILSDLLTLALNPSHGLERNGPAIARQFFLKFRTRVFLKSSCAAATAELEHGEAQFPTESSQTVSSLKQPKVLPRKVDPTKAGRKRVPSERQEENAAKRAKKIIDVKSMSADKRNQLKNPELQRSDGNSKVASGQNPQVRPVKKTERPARVEEPTYLVMKFPPGSALPSLMELKARFTRFGPLDTSLNRVFYKTSTCRVAFLYKPDANVAYRYAVGSKSLFSNVRFMLRPVAGPESQPPSGGKTDDLNGEPGFNQDSTTIESRPPTHAVLPQSGKMLKSILKKPSGVVDEPGGPSNGGGSSRTPRVRFSMGEEKSASGSNRLGSQVQLMESSNKGAPFSVGMDVNKNQKFLSPLPLQAPLLPLPQFVRPPINHQSHLPEIPINNFHENVPNVTTTTTGLPVLSQALLPPLPPQRPSTDISQQMMSLLTRCNDVVTNVTSVLGYVPYHSL